MRTPLKRCPVFSGPGEGRVDDHLINFLRNKQDMAIAKQKLDASRMVAPEFVILILVDGGLESHFANTFCPLDHSDCSLTPPPRPGTLANNRRLR